MTMFASRIRRRRVRRIGKKGFELGLPLLLPVETLSREFDSKLLLALHAAERGHDVTIGSRATLHDNLHRFPRSIYFSKGLRSGNRPIFRILKGLGHEIVALDEEGLVNPSEELLLMKIDPEVMGQLSVAFAWGEHDAAVYVRAKGAENLPVRVTGNPRVDLLRPELSAYFGSDVERIRLRFGRFALVNTNFAMVNHFIPDQTRFRVANWVSKNQAEATKSAIVEHKKQLFDTFRDLIPYLAHCLRPHSLVIRPHPSESHQPWIDAVRGCENAHVVHDGSVVPWLHAADVLIHNGCTSAVEAAVVGTPALAYRPLRNPGLDNDLPNAVSLEFETLGLLIAAARGFVDKERREHHELDPERRARLKRHIAALEGPLASQCLVDEIERLRGGTGLRFGDTRRLIAMSLLTRRRLSRAIRKRSAKAKGNPLYIRHKFPNISLTEVNARIEDLRTALGRFHDLSAEQIIPNLFRVVRRPS